MINRTQEFINKIKDREYNETSIVHKRLHQGGFRSKQDRRDNLSPNFPLKFLGSHELN